MKLTVLALAGLIVAGAALAADKGGAKVDNAFAFKMKGIDGKETDLSQFKGKVVLFVNVASKCGYTPQYEGLEKLYGTYKEKGFVVVGVPANNFGGQEPGSDAQIKEFCSLKYNVTFPMMSKVSVKGDDMAPLYKYLTTHGKDAGDVKWNFEKILVSKTGEVVGRFGSKVKPDSKDLTGAIEGELAK